MTDYFSRLILRTTGQADTVQPLIKPLFARDSDQPSVSEHQTLNLHKPGALLNKKPAHDNLHAGTNEMSDTDLSSRPAENISPENSYDSDSAKTGITMPSLPQLNVRGNKLSGTDTDNKSVISGDESAEDKDPESHIRKEDFRNIGVQKMPEGDYSSGLLPLNRSLLRVESMVSDVSSVSGEIKIQEKTICENSLKDEEMSYRLMPPLSKDDRSAKNADGNIHSRDLSGRNLFNDQNAIQRVPSVKVNIGRIEVKAVILQKSKQQGTLRRGPKLSLDEYLKQRNSGKR